MRIKIKENDILILTYKDHLSTQVKGKIKLSLAKELPGTTILMNPSISVLTL